MHLTFEEYFTARQPVSSATRARAEILKRLHQPRCSEPIPLAVGSLSKQFYDDTHDLLRAILEADSPHEEMLHRNLLFGRRLRRRQRQRRACPAPGDRAKVAGALTRVCFPAPSHAALLLGELGVSRCEDLGSEGRQRIADELVLLLGDPFANRVVYDFNSLRGATRVGPLYDVIYEALLRVVAGPDASGNTITQG